MFDVPQGLSLFRVIRRSKAKQHESVERQRDLTDSVIKMTNGKVYDEMILDDHSATLGAQWDHFYSIISRKKNGEQFDGIVASAYDRIGRTQDDCEQFYLTLKRAKLILVTHKEGMLSGKNKWITRQAAAAGNEAYAASISVNMNSGIMSLIKRGVIPHINVPLFATDRLFISAQTKKALFRLRWLRCGTVLKLDANDPDPANPLAIYTGPTRYDFPRRQKDELVMLVPGESEDMETIRRMFEMRYIENCGYTEIGERLNAEAIYSPTGRKWEFYSVKAVLANPAFTGIGACCKQGLGVHSFRHKDGPKSFLEARTAEEDDAGRARKKPELVVRPVSEWFVTRCPALRSMLPPHIRRRAKAWNRKDRQTPLHKARVDGLRRSEYFLAGIMRTPEGARLWGFSSKQGGKRYRKYYVDRTKIKGEMHVKGVYAKTIAAPLAEGAFKEVLSKVLLNDKELLARVQRAVEFRIANQHTTDDLKLQALIDERQEKEEHLKMIFAASPRAQRLASDEISKLEARLDVLDVEIGKERRPSTLDPRDVPSIVKSIFGRLQAEGETLEGATPKVLRRLASHLVDSIIYDGFARRVTFNLRLPRTIVTAPELLDSPWCNRGSVRESTTGTAPERPEMPFGSFCFEFSRGKNGSPAKIWLIDGQGNAA